MKPKHIRCLLFIIVPFLFFSTCSKAQPIEDNSIKEYNIDFSGVEKFLELTALLEKDQQPTQQQWDDMFDTPGYRILILREFNKNFLIERIKLAFMPSKKKALSILEKVNKASPDNLFNKYYLAEALLANGRTERGKALLKEIMATPNIVHDIGADAKLKKKAGDGLAETD